MKLMIAIVISMTTADKTFGAGSGEVAAAIGTSRPTAVAKAAPIYNGRAWDQYPILSSFDVAIADLSALSMIEC
jgi:hypothetical protein